MTCLKCGSHDIVKNEDGKYVCQSCGEVTEETPTEKMGGKKEKPVKSKGREAVEFLLPIVLAFVIAMVLKTCVFANAKVPSGSMLNTIYEQDRIIASRLEYKFHEPERGDIVIFKSPDDLAKGNTVYFIKRVIGLPGETVTIVNGVVYITDKDGNSEQLKEDYVTVEPPEGNYGPYVVPEDSYFVMGDNRNDSVDSRFWTTTHFVQKDLIIGKAKFCYYPFDHAGKFE